MVKTILERVVVFVWLCACGLLSLIPIALILENLENPTQYEPQLFGLWVFITVIVIVITGGKVPGAMKRIVGMIYDKIVGVTQEPASELYEQAEQEINDNTFDKGLWAKALMKAKGNEDVRKAEYIKLRARQLQSGAASSPKSDTAHFLVYDEKTGKMHSEFRYRGSNDFDTFPQGYGDFGTSVTNPIPTCGITGSSEYLACLRTENGDEIRAKRLGSTGAKNIKEIIDWYEIYNKRTNEKLCELYLCPYSRQTSTLAPKGFTLI